MTRYEVLSQRTAAYEAIDKAINILFSNADYHTVRNTIDRLQVLRADLHYLIIKAIREL